MQQVYKAIGRVAQTDATVLIRGPTGTGKELVARAIFQHSLRNDKPLMAMNCTAIPDTLLEGELFGYERGAFTGAHTRRIGKLEQSDGGTIFLDEIGDMPLTVQAKILRVLQEMRFERLGGNRTIQVDVRIIAATNRPLEEAMGAGLFRSDLYHRLNVFTINLPPLRERQEDIPLLTDFFLDRFSGRLGIDRPVVAPTAMSVLRAYPWPGNVRELEHCIHRALILTRGYPIQPADVRRTLETQGSIDTGVKPVNGTAAESLRSLVRDYLQNHNGSNTFTEYVDQVEKILVAEALRKTHGNQTHAARLLGLSRPTLQAKMQKYGIYKESRVHD
jgi:transcriptional regulator with GAF, ATPase, and Fis domain